MTRRMNCLRKVRKNYFCPPAELHPDIPGPPGASSRYTKVNLFQLKWKRIILAEVVEESGSVFIVHLDIAQLQIKPLNN